MKKIMKKEKIIDILITTLICACIIMAVALIFLIISFASFLDAIGASCT